MLDLQKISGNQVTGASCEELEFLELLTSQDVDWIFNQDTGLPEGEEDDTMHFPEIDNDTLQEIHDLEELGKNKNTSEQTTYFVRKFKSFLEVRKLPSCIETMPVKYLSQYLRLWYAKSKKTDGSDFAPATLICMRAAIQRFLTSSSVNREINIIDGQEFQLANATLKASIALFLRQNRGRDASTQAIDEEDLKLLSAYFNRASPERLQHEVFYSLIYHFGYRGREWLRSITKDSVKVCVDECGREYVDLLIPIQEKNVKPSTNRRHFESIKSIVMYSLPDNPSKCPVEAIKLYLTKLQSNALFPKPISSNRMWYSNKQNLGKNTLNDLMKKISSEARLSKIYTNHSIRATVVTEMADKGYTISEIQSVTGHKRAESVSRYIKRTTSSKKKKISNDLSCSLHSLNDAGNSGLNLATSSAQHDEMATSSFSEVDILSNTTKTTSIFRDCNFSKCNFNFSS